MMRRARPTLLLVAVLAACASPSVSTAPSQTPGSTPTVIASPRSAGTADPALAIACATLDLLVDLGPLVEDATVSISGEYSDWAAAADPLNDKMADILAALDQVPDVSPYVAWKAAVFEMLLHLSKAVIAYDTGMGQGTTSDLLLGSEYLQQATDSIPNMNAGAEFFSAGC